MSNAELNARLRAAAIAEEMVRAGVDELLILKALDLAARFEGVFDLLLLWHEADSNADKDATLIDLQESIDDIEDTPSREELPKIAYDDIDAVRTAVMAFKAGLRLKVDQWGGIAQLARATGIPQPSLSRFFNTPSLPRRTTLHKIAKAVGLTHKDIAFEHSV
jgi:DNA-binding phage protein